MTTDDVDPISMRIQLNELRSEFDNAMRAGELFKNLKKIYMRIKELECKLKVIEWQASKENKANTHYGHQQLPGPDMSLML